MSKSTYPLKLPTSVKNAAAELAKLDGVSLNQFIAAAVAEKGRTTRAQDRRRQPGVEPHQLLYVFGARV